jgi:hypothetical protein
MEKKQLQIRAFTINKDLHPWDLEPSVFNSATNFRLVDGKAIAANGHTAVWPVAPNSKFTSLVHMQRNELHYYVLSGGLNTCLYDGSTWSDISSADRVAAGELSSNQLQWTSCKLGFNIVINSSQHFPEYWSGNNGEVMQPLNFTPSKTWKQMNYRATVLRSHKDFLFALGLVEDGVEQPNAYRWSHPADTNGLPFTWDEMDLSAIASKESISGDFGAIVDGLSLRDSFCIYTERSIHVLDYAGDEFVFRRRLLSTSHGVQSPNCIIEAVGSHYFITENDIMVNDGNSLSSLLTNKLKSVFNNISTSYFKNNFACANQITNEAWFCLVEKGYEYPSIAIVYNWVTETLALRDITSSSAKGTLACITFGPDLPDPLPWDTRPTDWANYSHTDIEGNVSNWWNYSGYSPYTNTFFGIGPSYTQIQKIEGARTGVTTVLQRDSLALEGHINVTTLTRVYPHITSAGPVTFQFGSHDFNSSSIRWKPAIVFNPLTDRKIDIRTTGELQAWKITSVGTDFQMSGIDFEYTINGVR